MPQKPKKIPLKVIVTRKLDKQVEDRLCTLFDTELNATDSQFSQDQLIDAMTRADVLISTLNDRLDGETLRQASPNLRLIANYGAGFDHIDIKTADSRGIAVSNSPSKFTATDTADMAMALILAVMRRFKEGSAVMQSGDWAGWSPSDFLGGRLADKRLGILGMGRIGVELAMRARAFGLSIHYHNRKPVHPQIQDQLQAVYYDKLDDLLGQVDILSISCPFNEQTKNIMDGRALGLLPNHAIVINTSRGELIDEAVLAALLENGQLAGAGLDVLLRGQSINPSLRNMANVMLLPHMGSATKEARIEMGETVIYNIKMMEDGHTPPNRIIPSML